MHINTFPSVYGKNILEFNKINIFGTVDRHYSTDDLHTSEKINIALDQINYMLTKKNKKIRMKKLQQLTGFLNFLGKSVVPGRAFTRRFYAYTKSNMKPNHHLEIKGGNQSRSAYVEKFFGTPISLQ